jgi:cell division protein FtsA
VRSDVQAYAGERVVLTGGTSQLVDLGEFGANVLGRPTRVARPQPIAGMPSSFCGPAFSTVMGLGCAVQSQGDYVFSHHERKPLASGYLARMGRWLREGF